MVTKTGTIYTHRNLLRDLSEIKAVLDVESQLIEELVKIAIERQDIGFEVTS
jgi:regulator of RNase E activity RraB